MSSVPRIVVVDPSYAIARILHGAMVLLNRPCIMVEVPTAEDALEEILRSKTALVVTTYRLDSTDGVEFATHISRESLGTSVIVLADEGDPIPDKKSLEQAPFQYFIRPVAEQFLRGLRIALDGEEVVLAEERTTTSSSVRPELDLGPVPAINVNDMSDIVSSLMRDVGAMGVILADRTGRVLIAQGATGYVDQEKLAVMVGDSFSHSAEMGSLIGGNAWTMHYYDGERLDIFGLALGIHYFMCLIFDGTSRPFGAVNLFGRRAADQIIDLMGEVAYLIKKPEPLRVPAAMPPAPA
ncbi:MAG: roadblock/LC7 domain-containing protein, partial [Chloroflexi bacterium]|nr:roadblock/LC7 domain-containing protein [Chloroflexota bacterium]